jgi:hypothetical protein
MNRLTHPLDAIPWKDIGFSLAASLLTTGDITRWNEQSHKVFLNMFEEPWDIGNSDSEMYSTLELFLSLVAHWTDEELDEFLATFEDDYHV